MAIEQIQVRRDTAANWVSANPVLGAGEPAYETDTGVLKIGNGTANYSTLGTFARTSANGVLSEVTLNSIINQAQLTFDGRYAKISPRYNRASAVVTPKMAVDNSYEYEVLVVKGKGSTINDLVEKVYPNDYETTWTPGTPFAPGPATAPSTIALNTGAYVLMSGDAYETSKMTGVQIKGGVLYSGWGSASATPTGLGVEALAFMNDGTWRIYRQSAGHTPEQMVADGTDTSYGFGPVVVESGALRDITIDSQWAFFVSSVSARTILGRRANGDVVYIAVKGKSGVSGVAGNTMGQIALSEGCVDAILLDGGGTTQGYGLGYTWHPSSDAGGVRNSRCSIAIHAPLVGPIVSDWTNITYVSPGLQPIGNPWQASKTNGRTYLRGAVGVLSATANTWYIVGTLPERFRPASVENVRFSAYGNQNGNAGVVSIGTDGVTQIKFASVAAAGSNSWVQLDSIDFPAAY